MVPGLRLFLAACAFITEVRYLITVNESLPGALCQCCMCVSVSGKNGYFDGTVISGKKKTFLCGWELFIMHYLYNYSF